MVFLYRAISRQENEYRSHLNFLKFYIYLVNIEAFVPEELI